MGIDAGELLREGIFGDAVVVVETCLRTPADVQGAVDMGFAPVHDLADLIPVGDFGEVEFFDGGACDDHAVEVLVFDVVKGAVEGLQVFLGGVFGLMVFDADEFQLDL